MACACHGKKGNFVLEVGPYDQCTVCATKHISKAHELFREFLYTDKNRSAIIGQLRLAVDHMMYDNVELARKARDLSVMIEQVKDAEITTEWDDLIGGVATAFYKDHPDALERLNKLKEEHNQK